MEYNTAKKFVKKFEELEEKFIAIGKEYEEQITAVGKEVDKYSKRGIRSAIAAVVPLSATYFPSVRPYGFLATIALMAYTTFGPGLKVAFASGKRQKIEKQKLGKLEQWLEELKQVKGELEQVEQKS